MKSRFLRNRLNFEYPAYAYKTNTSIDNAATGFRSDDISRDYSKYRTKDTTTLDVFVEISSADQLDTFCLINTNLSANAQVYVMGSTTAGQAGFKTTTFSSQLTRARNNPANWILHVPSVMPSSKYFKFIIYDPTPVTTYFEIGKVIVGISESFPFQTTEGWSNETESFQKRSLENGQWTQGNANSELNLYTIPFRPANSIRTNPNSDYDGIKDMTDFFEDLKSSNPFIFILNPSYPEDLFDYVVISNSNMDFTSSDGEAIQFQLDLKETK